MVDRRFIYHVVAEIIVITGIAGFFYRRTAALEARIAGLEKHIETLRLQFSTLVAEVQVAVRGGYQPYIPSTYRENTCPIPAQCTEVVDTDDTVVEISFDDMIAHTGTDSASETAENMDQELESELAELDIVERPENTPCTESDIV